MRSCHSSLPAAVLTVAAFSVVVLAACTGGGGDSGAQTPPGLEPLEDNAASLPSDESVDFASSDTDDYHDTNARGRVLAPLAAVAACVQNPEVGVDRRRVSEFSVDTGVDADYDVSYDVVTTVVDLLTLTYTLTWVQGEQEDGSWAGRWSKAVGDRETDANAELLETLDGSLLVQAIDETQTDVGIIEHLEATMTSTSDTEQFTGDFYASIVACAHGEPLPTY